MTRRLARAEAAELLAHGHVVAVATDTVYGLAAALAHPAAVATLFALKRRPTSVALPVLVSSVRDVEGLGVEWSPTARALSDAWWPGALTVVVAAPPALAALVGGRDAVGFRVPDDDALRALLGEVGPLAVSSANEHGHPPCQSADDVLAAFADRDELAGVVDEGPRDGEVSTVVVLEDGAWRLVRAGAVGEDDLRRVLD